MGVCVLQVTLAYESIVLYMCEGKVLMDKTFSYIFKVCQRLNTVTLPSLSHPTLRHSLS